MDRHAEQWIKAYPRAKYWLDKKGYKFNPEYQTAEYMDRQAEQWNKAYPRAKYWKDTYNLTFNPEYQTADFIDREAKRIIRKKSFYN